MSSGLNLCELPKPLMRLAPRAETFFFNPNPIGDGPQGCVDASGSAERQNAYKVAQPQSFGQARPTHPRCALRPSCISRDRRTGQDCISAMGAAVRSYRQISPSGPIGTWIRVSVYAAGVTTWAGRMLSRRRRQEAVTAKSRVSRSVGPRSRNAKERPCHGSAGGRSNPAHS